MHIQINPFVSHVLVWAAIDESTRFGKEAIQGIISGKYRGLSINYGYDPYEKDTRLRISEGFPMEVSVVDVGAIDATRILVIQKSQSIKYFSSAASEIMASINEAEYQEMLKESLAVKEFLKETNMTIDMLPTAAEKFKNMLPGDAESMKKMKEFALSKTKNNVQKVMDHFTNNPGDAKMTEIYIEHLEKDPSIANNPFNLEIMAAMAGSYTELQKDALQSRAEAKLANEKVALYEKEQKQEKQVQQNAKVDIGSIVDHNANYYVSEYRNNLKKQKVEGGSGETKPFVVSFEPKKNVAATKP